MQTQINESTIKTIEKEIKKANQDDNRAIRKIKLQNLKALKEIAEREIKNNEKKIRTEKG